MSSFKSIDDVLHRIEEMRISLKFSDEIFPLLSDMFLFIKDVIPLMLEANMSVREGTNKLPTASENIAKVSKTTEVATHQVMDKLDSILNQVGTLSRELSANGQGEKYLPLVEQIQNEATDIIYALQFQDITTQQLEHANRILKAIYDRFMLLFKSVKHMRSSTNIGAEVIQAIENEVSTSRLHEDREEFRKQTEDMVRKTEISQDDIDNFFKQIR